MGLLRRSVAILLLVELFVDKMENRSLDTIVIWGFIQFWRLNFGVLDKLAIIQERGHKNILVHTDSLEFVKALQANHLENSPSALVTKEEGSMGTHSNGGSADIKP
ncbi:hypothetical protein J1N35_033109 [Gossypium stocksii]|uniref:RNase H type-1 domain-containing protein n=1 Tax=Gossypium stocksii TaxID=47602 RepID=A0A9D3ZNV8_9ROSI|nr:hypothetical protein J1N35_033109 [Gossypium stocksii]